MTSTLQSTAAWVAHVVEGLSNEEWALEHCEKEPFAEKKIPAAQRHWVKTHADALLLVAQDLDLPISKKKAATLSWFATNIQETQLADLRNRIRETRETFMQELWAIKFLPATGDMVAYLGKVSPYGKLVEVTMPECSEDIAEAHQCFAFGQYTATAFHISRAMEVAVRCVAKKMRITASRDEWQSYINAMDESIKKMPFKTVKDKARRSLYSEASNYLFNFKEAFRNRTMHPKKTYTRKESLRVLESAGDFLRHISATFFKSRAKSKP